MAKSENTTKITELFRKRYEDTHSLAEPFFSRVEVNKNLYKGLLNADDSYEWDYNLVDPHVFPLVRNYLSRSNPSMNTIKLDSRRGDDLEAKQVNQDFLNWEINELMGTTLFYRMYFSAYLAGRGYIKTGWKHENAIEIQEKDAETGEIVRTKIIRDVTNRADAQFVRYNNILIPDRNNPDLQTQPYIIELLSLRIGAMLDENERLKKEGKDPFWDEKFFEDARKSDIGREVLDYEVARVLDDCTEDDLAFRSAIVSLMAMHTLEGKIYYMPVKGYEHIINKDTSNPYWHGHYPFIDFCPFPEDDEYFNISLVDVVGDLQIAATEVLNQTLTNIRAINTDMWVLGSGANQTPNWQFQKRPNGVIRVMGDASQVQQISTRDNTRQAMLVAQELGNKIEKAGGIGSLYASGTSGSQDVNQTARGAQIIDQNIDTNMRMIIDLFGEQVLKRLGEHFLELNAQYVTEEQTFSVTGKKGVSNLIKISPDQICANFKVLVNTEKVAKQTPASEQASLQNSITVLQNIETSSQGKIEVDLVPVVEALVDATPSLDDINEELISTIDEKADRDAMMLSRGQMPKILIRDQHEDLIVAVNVKFPDISVYPEEFQQLLEEYVNKHLQYIQSQQQVMAMKAPQVASMNNMMSGAMGQPSPNQGEQAGLPENQKNYNLGQIA